jgi:polyferredoxin
MSIQTSFSNNVFKAYRDLATFGPMEAAMYERYTDLEQDKKKAKPEKKPMSTGTKIFLIILLVIIITVVFVALSGSGFNPFFLFINN